MNTKTIFRCVVLLILWGALLTPQVAAAQENGFEFAEDEASFSWKDVQDGEAKIVVLNKDVSELPVEFFISGIDFLEIEHPSSGPNLPAGGSLEIALTAVNGSDPKPEVYTGYLNASLKDSKTTLHLPLTITVGEVPTPVSDTWEVKHIMPVFFWDKNQTGQYKNRYIPIKTEEGQLCEKGSISLEPDAALGTLILTGKDTAEVTWSGEVSKLDDGNCALELTFKGLDKPGEYSGPIDLLPDDEENGDVTLTVISTHNIVDPIIVIIFSVVLSSFAVKGTNINRPVLELFKNEADTNKLNDPVEERYKGYTIVDFDNERNRIVDNINKLQKSLKFKFSKVLDENNKDYKSIVTDLKELDAKVEAWNNDFPKDLDILEVGLKDIAKDEEPAFWDKANELVELEDSEKGKLVFGKPLHGKTTFADQHKKIKNAGILCRSWLIWEKEYQVYEYKFDQIEEKIDNNDPFLKQIAFTTKFELSKVCTLLWETEGLEHFDSFCIDESLRTIEKLLAGLMDFPVKERVDKYWEEEGADTLAILLREKKELAFPLFYDYPAILPEKSTARLAVIERILNRNDLLMIVIAAIGGVLAGLQAKYFSQPVFGTFEDYVNVFTWGLGTEAAIEGIWAALSRFVVSTKE